MIKIQHTDGTTKLQLKRMEGKCEEECLHEDHLCHHKIITRRIIQVIRHSGKKFVHCTTQVQNYILP